jgi:mannose-6-phosphate isomerase-like protein (cupin superfamily)
MIIACLLVQRRQPCRHSPRLRFYRDFMPGRLIAKVDNDVGARWRITMPDLDRTKIAADWQARGFGCDLWVDPPGQRWEDFRHETDELVTVLEGQMEFEIAGKVHHPTIGEELLIPAGAIHSARNVGSTTARWLYGYKRG